jgi:hypothetical protein
MGKDVMITVGYKRFILPTDAAKEVFALLAQADHVQDRNDWGGEGRRHLEVHYHTEHALEFHHAPEMVWATAADADAYIARVRAAEDQEKAKKDADLSNLTPDFSDLASAAPREA